MEYAKYPRVRAITTLSRSTIWRLEKQGLFPRRRQLSPGNVAWVLSEIEAWAASRPPTNDEDNTQESTTRDRDDAS